MRRCEKCGTSGTECPRDAPFPCWDRCRGCGAEERRQCDPSCTEHPANRTMSLAETLRAASEVTYRFCPSCASPIDTKRAAMYVPIRDGSHVRVCHTCRAKWRPEMVR
jgi:hypothetical protein